MKNPCVASPRSSAPQPSATRLPTMSIAFLTGTRCAGAIGRYEQFVARLVDREAEALVEGIRQQDGPDPGHQPDDRRAEAERDRQDEHRDGDAEAAKRRPRDEELQREARRAQREVEGAEKARERVGIARESLVGDEAQLEGRPLRGDRHEKYERRHQPQVRAARDLTHRIAHRLAALRHRTRDDRAPNPRVGNRHDHRRQDDERGEHEQHVHGAADGLDEVPRQHAAGNRAKRRARADEPEQPLRLPGVEERVGKAPRLHRRDDAEAVDPDEEDARQELERVETERVPEEQHVGREKEQRRDRDQPRADPGDRPVVERHEQRQRDRDRGVHVHERVRAVLLEEKPVSDRLGEQERSDDGSDIQEGKKDRQTLARPDVKEPSQPLQHGFPAVYFSFCIA